MAGVVLNKMSLANLVIRLGSLGHGNPRARHAVEVGRKPHLDFECEKISVINFKRLKIHQYIGIR